MARRIKFIKERIDALIKHQSYSGAAKELGLDISPLRKYVLRALNAGYVKEHDGTWLFGTNYSSSHPDNGHFGGQLWELHGVEIKFPVLNVPGWWREQKQIFRGWTDFQKNLLSETPNDVMNQHFFDFHDIDSFHVKTTTKHVFLVMKADTKERKYSLSGSNPKDLQKKIVDVAFNYHALLEKRFCVKLGSVDGVEFSIPKQHYANIGNKIAREFLKERIPLNVFVDGHLRTVVDLSKGVLHFEQVDAKESPLDAEAWHRLIANVNTGKFNEEKVVDDLERQSGLSNGFSVNLDKLAGIVEGVADNQVMFQKNFESHVEAIRSLSSGVSELKAVVADVGRKAKGLPVSVSSFGLLEQIKARARDYAGLLGCSELVKQLSPADYDSFMVWLSENQERILRNN